jgi:hypothetical protein
VLGGQVPLRRPGLGDRDPVRHARRHRAGRHNRQRVLLPLGQVHLDTGRGRRGQGWRQKQWARLRLARHPLAPLVEPLPAKHLAGMPPKVADHRAIRPRVRVLRLHRR